jgi:hypothetical protein
MGCTIRVFSFKEGLLSRMAHDLELTLTRFSVTQNGRSLIGRFDPGSLRVEGAVRDGQLDHEALSSSDRDKILAHLREDVLRIARFPEARFAGRVQGEPKNLKVVGELTLCGRTLPVEVPFERRAGELVGRVELTPSQFGVAPFKALGGALKVKDCVRVEITVDSRFVDREEPLEQVSHTYSPD